MDRNNDNINKYRSEYSNPMTGEDEKRIYLL